MINAKDTYDIVIYGATSAGIAAAIQASRMGLRTVVLEPGDRIGGLTAGGLGDTDHGQQDSDLRPLAGTRPRNPIHLLVFPGTDGRLRH